MKYKITLNNKIYEVEVERGEAILSAVYEAATAVTVPEQPAENAPTPLPMEEGEVISSPLPGTVLRVNVVVGDSVQKGQVLLVLEAMKMENDIIAPKEGMVTYVAAAAGATVNTGDTLITIS